MFSSRFLIALGLSVLWTATLAVAQPPGANYDEAKVPPYTLPDPLVMANGQKVADAETWRKQRRPEILELFETHMYGRSPGRPEAMTCEVTSVDKQALGGKAVRKEVSIHFTGKQGRAADGPPDLPAQRGQAADARRSWA